MTEWNDFEVFEAPAPNAGERLRLSISQELIDTNFKVMKLTPIFQISVHLFARLPLINLISMVEQAKPTPQLTTLDEAYACFQGIKRPHDDDDTGENVLVYVLKPTVTIERQASMACQARAAFPPKNCVLTVLVRTNGDLHLGGEKVDGRVTRLEWVFADGDNSLPKHHENRYTRRHW